MPKYLPTKDLEVEGIGRVRVRQLTRAEVRRFSQLGDDNDPKRRNELTDELNVYLLTDAVVEWPDGAPENPNEDLSHVAFNAITDGILEFSGLLVEGASTEESAANLPETPGG